MRVVTITEIDCEHTISNPGSDDVIILGQSDGGAPKRVKVVNDWHLKTGDTLSFTSSDSDQPVFEFSSSVYLGFWDLDGPTDFVDQADMTGNFYLVSDDIEDGEGYVYTIIGDHNAVYNITFSVTTIPDPQDPPAGVSLDGSLIKAINSAVEAWEDSHDGKDANSTSDCRDIADDAKSGIESGTFDDVITTLQRLHAVKAISLGVMAQAEVFVGLYGCFGMAADLSDLKPSDFSDSCACYVGTGFADGAEAGVDGDLAFGVWFQNTADIGGVYVGADASFVDVEGVDVAVFIAEDDVDDFGEAEGSDRWQFVKVLFIGDGAGIDDGFEDVELVFFAGHKCDNPTYQTGDYDHAIMIEWITCNGQRQDEYDDINIQYQIDKTSATDIPDPTWYNFAVWKGFQMQDTYSGDSPPSNPFASDQAIKQKTFRPGGGIIQCNTTVNPYILIDNAAIEMNTDNAPDFLEISEFSGVGSRVTRSFLGSDGGSYDVTFRLMR